jgi:hypothetical protein
MAIVARIDGVTIVFHFNEHGMPHFHAVTAEDRATLEIDSLEMIEGWIPRSKYHLVKRWAGSRKRLLLRAWDTCRSGETPEKIP